MELSDMVNLQKRVTQEPPKSCSVPLPEDSEEDGPSSMPPFMVRLIEDEEGFEKEYNTLIKDFYNSLSLLDDWRDFAMAVRGKDLRDLIGSAYGEFIGLYARTSKLLDEWDRDNLIEEIPDCKVVDGVIVDEEV